MAQGIFITLEGGEGVGKSTQSAMLTHYFESIGKTVVKLREPGSTPIGEQIRAILLDPKNENLNSISELLLFEAARAQMVQEVVKPALEQGCVVISDRFCDSTVAYQGYARALGAELVKTVDEISRAGIIPDRTILLVRDTQEGLESAKTKGDDRLEAESLEFHQLVHRAFDELAKDNPSRIRRIETNPDAQITFEAIIAQLQDLIDEISES